MRARLLALLLGLYVSMDLSNPWMPGAFVFDPDESVEGFSVRRDTWVAPVTAEPRSGLPVGRPKRVLAPGTPPARPLSEWVVELRRAHVPSHDLAPPTEDH